MPNSRLLDRACGVHALFIRMASSLESPFLLLVRLYWGWQFSQAGWGKLHRLPQVTEFFASLNIPMPGLNAALVSGMEFAGGILLILGLASRLTALLLAFDMLVAYLTADRAALQSVIPDPGKFYTADPYTFLFASLLILIFGPGRWAVDALLRSRERQPAAVPA
ncbi:MAG TPA: DoxX family protein [Acidobacteriaceae bacterium]|nr:DoxX family protein [Acidobacteriaceae bacterium]